eukprot:s7_g5.t1
MDIAEDVRQSGVEDALSAMTNTTEIGMVEKRMCKKILLEMTRLLAVVIIGMTRPAGASKDWWIWWMKSENGPSVPGLLRRVGIVVLLARHSDERGRFAANAGEQIPNLEKAPRHCVASAWAGFLLQCTAPAALPALCFGCPASGIDWSAPGANDMDHTDHGEWVGGCECSGPTLNLQFVDDESDDPVQGVPEGGGSAQCLQRVFLVYLALLIRDSCLMDLAWLPR